MGCGKGWKQTISSRAGLCCNNCLGSMHSGKLPYPICLIKKIWQLILAWLASSYAYFCYLNLSVLHMWCISISSYGIMTIFLFKTVIAVYFTAFSYVLFHWSNAGISQLRNFLASQPTEVARKWFNLSRFFLEKFSQMRRFRLTVEGKKCYRAQFAPSLIERIGRFYPVS